MSVSAEEIKDKILKNYFGYLKLFTPVQSNFLSDIYKRYQCLDRGNIVLYFAKKTHQAILRKKEFDLNHNLSFEKFWDNHTEIVIENSTIIDIAKNTSLPKETARRKLAELIKQKVFFKTKKNIIWKPTDEYKKSYNTIVSNEIRQLAKLTKYITDKIDLNFSTEEIVYEYKKKFSFYWFHYLDLQLKWMKLWKHQLKDLEMVMIFMELVNLLSSKASRPVSHEELFTKPEIINEPKKKNLNVSISATSLSDITGIPRASCIRKLNQMSIKKMVIQDENSKRYYIIPEALQKNIVSKELTKKVSVLFSKFYFVTIKALIAKNSH